LLVGPAVKKSQSEESEREKKGPDWMSIRITLGEQSFLNKSFLLFIQTSSSAQLRYIRSEIHCLDFIK
jgi:hypothetical protein